MAHLFSHYSCEGYFYQQECLSSRIRLSIFLITEVFVGLPAVVWALRVLYHHHERGSRVSVFMISLLLSDLLVLLLNPYIVIKLFQEDFCWKRNKTCYALSSLWSGSLLYGIQLQQVVVLEGAVSLRYSSSSADAFFPKYSIIVSFFLYTYCFLCERFEEMSFIILGLLFVLAIILTVWIINCKAPFPISDAPFRSRKPSFTVLAFVTFTVILCVIFISMCTIMEFTQTHYWDLFIMGVCLMSLNVIIDPLLCVLICRKHTEINKSEV